jgi:hypothetical protein
MARNIPRQQLTTPSKLNSWDNYFTRSYSTLTHPARIGLLQCLVGPTVYSFASAALYLHKFPSSLGTIPLLVQHYIYTNFPSSLGMDLCLCLGVEMKTVGNGQKKILTTFIFIFLFGNGTETKLEEPDRENKIGYILLGEQNNSVGNILIALGTGS